LDAEKKQLKAILKNIIMIDEDRKFKAFPKDIYIICLELQRSWAHGTNNDL